MKRENITCGSHIEDNYYNKARRTLRLEDSCVNCGALRALDFLFGLKELREKCLTGEHICLPICNDCLGCGKKLVKGGGGCNGGEEGERESKW